MKSRTRTNDNDDDDDDDDDDMLDSGDEADNGEVMFQSSSATRPVPSSQVSLDGSQGSNKSRMQWAALKDRAINDRYTMNYVSSKANDDDSTAAGSKGKQKPSGHRRGRARSAPRTI